MLLKHQINHIFNLNVINIYFKIFFKDYKIKYLILLFLMILNGILEFISIGALIPLVESVFNQAGITKKIFSYLNLNIPKENLFYISLIFFILIFIIKSFFSFMLVFFKCNLYELLRNNLSNKIADFNLNSNILKIQSNGIAKLIRHIASDVEIVSQNITDSIFSIFLNFILIFFTLLLVLSISPQALYTGLAFSIITSIIYLKFFTSKIKKISNIRRENDAKKLQVLQNIFSSFKEIKILNKIIYFKKNFNDIIKEYIKSDKLYQIIQGSIRPLLEILAVVAMVFYAYVTYRYYYSDKIFIEFAIVATSFIKLLPSLNSLLFNIIQIKYFTPSSHAIYDSIQKYNIQKKIKKVKIINFKEEINLKKISFSYAEEKIVLKNFNLKLSKNDILGIYGPSGSGKTTIINILLGFLKPDSGEIFIDGKKAPENYLLNSSYVSQSPAVINDTIENNIALGSIMKKIKIDKINNSLELSGFYNFVTKLEQKNKTIINDFGYNLSGGQKQRLSLSRAFYNKKNIVVLDEPTSALDKSSRDFVLKNIFKKFKTVIIITHDKSILKYCTNIIYTNKINKY
jgi:ATP-binding cassette, subfamily B, bacterial PglK